MVRLRSLGQLQVEVAGLCSRHEATHRQRALKAIPAERERARAKAEERGSGAEESSGGASGTLWWPGGRSIDLTVRFRPLTRCTLDRWRDAVSSDRPPKVAPQAARALQSPRELRPTSSARDRSTR